jgi:hypothetical protein
MRKERGAKGKGKRKKRCGRMTQRANEGDQQQRVMRKRERKREKREGNKKTREKKRERERSSWKTS